MGRLGHAVRGGIQHVWRVRPVYWLRGPSGKAVPRVSKPWKGISEAGDSWGQGCKVPTNLPTNLRNNLPTNLPTERLQTCVGRAH